jgi:two-component system sensor histidine kinase UhpB
MSLRLRTLCAVALVLLIGSVTGIAVADWQAGQVLREELDAALAGGRQAVAGALRAHPPSGDDDATLRRIVRGFDGDRHVGATLVDPTGRVIARSIPLKARTSPAWFAAAFRFPVRPIAISEPASRASVMLRPVFADDVGAIWSEFVELTLVLAASWGAACAMIWLTVGHALKPLSEFGAAFQRIGSGDYDARVGEHGPIELVRLGRGVNAMTARLGSMHVRTQALETQLSTLQDEERADLARDLHDEIGPHLFAVNVDAAMVRRLIEESHPDEALGQVAAIEASVGHMQTLVRDILGRLRPTELVELGLVEAIGELVSFWRSRRPAIRFDVCLAPVERLPLRVSETIYRVVQEGLNNAVRHGLPHEVRLTLQPPLDGFVVVEVADDGAAAKPASTQGYGLIGMRERVAAANGKLTIDQGERGSGWTIRVQLPLAAHGEAEEAART